MYLLGFFTLNPLIIKRNLDNIAEGAVALVFLFRHLVRFVALVVLNFLTFDHCAIFLEH